MYHLAKILCLFLIMLMSAAAGTDTTASEIRKKASNAGPEFAQAFRLAEIGHAAVQLSLGERFLFGRDLPEDLDQARAWLLLSAHQGLSRAQYLMGWLHLKGQGVPRDFDEAARWFGLAAEQGHDEAAAALAVMRNGPNRVTLFTAPVARCDKLAADPADQRRYTKGVREPQIDAESAIDACSEATAKSPRAARFHFQLGRALSKAGRYAEAMAHFQRAAHVGYAAAENEIGYLLMSGSGVDRDTKRGLAWFRKSAEQGNAKAQFNTAKFSLENRSAPVEMPGDALDLLMRSARQGYPPAQALLGEMFRTATGVKKSYERAAFLLGEAV